MALVFDPVDATIRPDRSVHCMQLWSSSECAWIFDANVGQSLGCTSRLERREGARVRAGGQPAQRLRFDRPRVHLTDSTSQVPMCAAWSARRLRSSLACRAASACLRATNSSSAVKRAPRPRMRSCNASSTWERCGDLQPRRTQRAHPRFQLGRGHRSTDEVALRHRRSQDRPARPRWHDPRRLRRRRVASGRRPDR